MDQSTTAAPITGRMGQTARIPEGWPMTEAQWLASSDPTPMLEFLRDKASDRKLRLFACACCRLVWHLLTDERSQRAVAAAERYADGVISARELNEAADTAYDAYTEAKVADGYAPDSDVHPEYVGHVPFVAHSTTRDVDLTSDWVLSLMWGDLEAPCDLFRCVFGNPFRPASLDPAWLAWHDGTILRLAQAINDDRDLPSGHLDNFRLAILADALEDAGCQDADILGHCRQPGLHVRGCWVVDLILGKA
jgi:hypothetical protein